MFIIGLLIGMLLGGFFGLLIMALMNIAKYSDNERKDK